MNEEQILLYHSGELTELEMRLVEEMIKGDPKLKAFYDDLLEQETFFGDAFKSAQSTPTEMVDMALVQAELTTASKKVVSMGRWALAAAACIAISIGVIYNIAPTGNEGAGDLVTGNPNTGTRDLNIEDSRRMPMASTDRTRKVRRAVATLARYKHTEKSRLSMVFSEFSNR